MFIYVISDIRIHVYMRYIIDYEEARKREWTERLKAKPREITKANQLDTNPNTEKSVKPIQLGIEGKYHCYNYINIVLFILV